MVVVCNLCNLTVKNSSGTTNLKTHIECLSQASVIFKTDQSPEFFEGEPEVKKQNTLRGMLWAKYAFNSSHAMSITRGITDYILDDIIFLMSFNL